MNNKEFGKVLEKRTKDFAIKILTLSSGIPMQAEYKIIKYQLTKSGTSIGANYREANRSRSKSDFINKMRICESEASETLYWLEIIEELNIMCFEELYYAKNEAKELLAIMTAIGYKLRDKSTYFRHSSSL